MIYFIQQGEFGPIKIGYSKNPDSRLVALATATPFPLVLLGTVIGDKSDERELHKHFIRYKIRGEWFAAEEPLMDAICEMLGHNPFSDALAHMEWERMQEKRAAH